MVPDSKLQQSALESRTYCSYRCPEGANKGAKASDGTESQNPIDLSQSVGSKLAFQRDFLPGVQLDADRDDFRSWLTFFSYHRTFRREPTVLVNRSATVARNSKVDRTSWKLRT